MLFRSRLDDIGAPLMARDRDGTDVAVYGMPYLEPDLHRETLGAERSHAAVLDAAMGAVRADLAGQDARSIVVAHAFITGSSTATVSDSERDLRVGGIADAPASLFDGVDYVALGHLHGAQAVSTGGQSSTTVRYSGSPIAFSFSEQDHVKSVTLLEVAGSGPVTVELIDVPVFRELTTLTGTLEEILDTPDNARFADHWVRVQLTDERRPANPMDRLRELMPHVVDLSFVHTASRESSAEAGTSIAVIDPLEIAESFISHVTSTPPEPVERDLLRASVERVRVAMVPE